jgi:hypothetical protein
MLLEAGHRLFNQSKHKKIFIEKMIHIVNHQTEEMYYVSIWFKQMLKNFH